jgi:2',3'-cyclic-nucleotide 2'-phosphodiesterase (5'-nucleotidase family)
MPFENELVVVTLPSSSFRKLLDYLVAWGGQPVAGLRMEIKDGKPVNVSVNGTPVTDADTSSYRVATSDYLLGGGDKMTFLAEGTEKVFLNYKLRDAILDYCMGEYKAGRNLNALLDGRIKNITN